MCAVLNILGSFVFCFLFFGICGKSEGGEDGVNDYGENVRPAPVQPQYYPRNNNYRVEAHPVSDLEMYPHFS